MSERADIPISRSVAFPDLEPAVALARRRKRSSRVISRSLELSHELTHKIELVHESAVEEEVVPSKREEPKNLTATLTVYVLNIILMFISFPIGMAMLIFNIIGGENLRTTAHVIALTGTGIALSMTELGQAILQSL